MPRADELPASTPAWTPDPARAVLLVHDMQRYFLAPFPAGQQPVTTLVDNAARIRDCCAALSVPVAYTAQPGGMDAEQRGLLRDFWGPGMTPSAEHRQVVAPLAPAPGDWVFTKWRYSAFHRTELLAHMRAAGRDQLILCGVYAHVGVLMTAVEAFSHDIQPFLVADAVADFSPEEHHMALQYAATRCAALTTAEELVTALMAGPPSPVGAGSRKEES
ncbi:isochorismatase family protein [Streptomyces sp. HNM0663]|uniref:Isochorismatase family protein n=1 Tax=Streptomyces chengmaiensis TaxID=3040919 RepID=A0ABT6HX79_9ACTN|nr:isochorismatase family protein [Streptomyces chengmaiensis]MDH2393010.1 isochorismatase family protein [Streptomyces chengmaiensis]